MTQLDLPSVRDEAWRWSRLESLPALAAATPTGDAVDVDHLWIGDGPRLLFVDGKLDAARSRTDGLTLAAPAVSSQHPLGKLANAADGWTLALGTDHAAAGTIEIIHVATGGANQLASRIALGPDAQASLVETFVGHGWQNRLSHIGLDRGARLMRATRILSASGFISTRDEAVIGEGASLVATVAGLGGAGTRTDAEITLAGDGGFAEFGGVLLGSGDQHHDAAVVLRHAAPHGSSRQFWRAVANDMAKVNMAARVEVARGAQKTDGEQSLRGLLLKRTASVNLKPELEIFADDVKCAHGATVGELDRQALFYLESRGLPPERARGLLTRAFVADVVERIGDEAVRAAFLEDAAQWLENAL